MESLHSGTAVSPLQVTHLLRPASVRVRAIVEAVFFTGGAIGTLGEVARRLSLRNRFALARLLKQEGLPGLRELANWAAVLRWVMVSERTGATLCSQALASGRDPAVCYRIVRRVTGLPWAVVRKLGSSVVLERFLSRCRAPYHAG
jgi:hypothetical protein